MRSRFGWLTFPLLIVLACQPAAREEGSGAMQQTAAESAAPGTPEWKIANASSAGPATVSADATVMDWAAQEGGEMQVLRPGANGWTCMPDIPNTPGNDPMCLDGSFIAWAGAWMSKTKPDIQGVGFGYMLQGGTDASNTDPYATEPAPGEDWVKAGPHVMMVVPNPASLESLPTDPNNGGPWVMWKGTPYAHVMMPVTGS